MVIVFISHLLKDEEHLMCLGETGNRIKDNYGTAVGVLLYIVSPAIYTFVFISMEVAMHLLQFHG